MRCFLVFLLACGGSSSDPDATPVADADPADVPPRFGDSPNQVIVRESIWPGIQSRGDLTAGFATDDPSNLLTETMRAGQCRLLTSDAAYCPGPCNGFCVGMVCHPWPSYRDAGRITFTGLSTSIALTNQGGYYAPESFPVPTDLFDADDPITSTAAGADFPAFTVAATGVATLAPQLTGACDNVFQAIRGQDATIQWTAATPGSRIRMRIPSENRGHGLPPIAVIECEGPDVGALTVPAALLEAMPDFREVASCDGIACVSIDCPPSTIARYSKGSALAEAEDVELRVESEVTFLVYDN